MSTPISFTSSIDLPDGRRIYVSIDVPADLGEFPDVGDHAEIAQMAASHALGVIYRGDLARQRRDEKVPF